MRAVAVACITFATNLAGAQQGGVLKAPEEKPNIALVRHYAEAQGVDINAPNVRDRYVASLVRLHSQLRMYADVSPLIHNLGETEEQRNERAREFMSNYLLPPEEAPDAALAADSLIEQMVKDGTLPDRFLADEIWGRALIPPVREPGSYFDYDSHHSLVTPARNAAKLHVLSMRLAEAQDDEELYIDSARAVRGVAYGMSRNPGLLSYLTAISVEAVLLREIRRDLMEGVLSDTALLEIAELLAIPALADAEICIIGEYIGNHDLYSERFELIRDPVFRELLDHWFRLSLDALSHDYHGSELALRKLDELEDDLENHPAERFWVTVPATGGYADAVRSIRCELLGCRTMVAIARYERTHGEPPASLAGLVPEFLESVPMDPNSNQPLGYQLIENDEHARRYLLYSVGFDGEDNGGKLCPEGNVNARGRSRAGVGYDYIINHPDR